MSCTESSLLNPKDHFNERQDSSLLASVFVGVDTVFDAMGFVNVIFPAVVLFVSRYCCLSGRRFYSWFDGILTTDSRRYSFRPI